MSDPDVLLFDLFGTLVFFDDTRIPTVEVGGRRLPNTIPDLEVHVARYLPGVDLKIFLRELKAASLAVAEQKRREGIEMHTSVRFERAMLALGAPSPVAVEAGSHLAGLHMESLAGAVVCPDGRADLLARLARSHRLALLSNFDDGAAARRILARAGLYNYFELIVISEEEGLRKPSRKLFEVTCERLATRPADCLYIGDTLVEDVEGATGAGVAAVWIHPDETAASPAMGVIADVELLPGWLVAQGFSGRGDASR